MVPAVTRDRPFSLRPSPAETNCIEYGPALARLENSHGYFV
jgi:hypothetical protein